MEVSGKAIKQKVKMEAVGVRAASLEVEGDSEERDLTPTSSATVLRESVRAWAAKMICVSETRKD